MAMILENIQTEQGVMSKVVIMDEVWGIFCGQESTDFMSVTQPSSCLNHGMIICFDMFLIAVLLFTIVFNNTNLELMTRARNFSAWKTSSSVFNGCLGMVYLGLGGDVLAKKQKNDHTVVPIHWWVLLVFQGFTWLSFGLVVILRGAYHMRILPVFAFFFTGVAASIALFTAIVKQDVTVKVILDILSFIGASFLLVFSYKHEDNRIEGIDISTLYTPLTSEDRGSCSTLFEKAGVFSKMTFWWLNPLMKSGKEKALEDEDIPILRDEERAKNCYSEFMDRLSDQKHDEIVSQSSILRTIVGCYWKEILISGLFALLKILTISAGPLLLKAFVEISQGKEGFRYEGYLLAMTLFVAKAVESFSQRQWYFRSRLIGLKVRSIFTAMIYSKQLRLSNVAKRIHSNGEIMNYVTTDAYRIGEFPFWFHQIWTTALQLSLALVILIRSVGPATVAALLVISLTVLCNAPLAKLHQKLQTKLMVAQDERLKAFSEALVNMKVLKLYAWETRFKEVVMNLREEEYRSLSAVQLGKAYLGILFWSSPVLVSTATFGACYFLGVPLNTSNVFTFVATLRLVQEPVRIIPDVISVVIQARVGFARIVKFLQAPEIQRESVMRNTSMDSTDHVILIKSANLSWEMNSSRPTLRNINLDVKPGDKVAICGEVGSGKSTLLAAILGEVPHMEGRVKVHGKIAYVSQTAWIQTGTIQENILFGSSVNETRYQETLKRCSLVKDLELLPHGDRTEIGERGVNLSGGQKQRVQLARALYQDADIYLLDDPFSAVDAHTASSLFTEYVLEALSNKTVFLVTHQVDFLPAFDACLLMFNGEILRAGKYNELLASSQEFTDLVNAHKETAGTKRLNEVNAPRKDIHSVKQISKTDIQKKNQSSDCGQLIKREEREIGDVGLKPYLIYLNQNRGYLFFSLAAMAHIIFVIGQILQNSWMASNVDDPQVTKSKLILVYLIIGFTSISVLLIRSLLIVKLGIESSKSIFSQLSNSLFRAPMSFYDSTPQGRILSRASFDLSIVDLDVSFSLLVTFAGITVTYSNLIVLAVITWQVLFVSIPVIYMVIKLQRYYFATAKELMRINGTTKSLVANHLTESIAGAVIIRAFEEEERFISKNFDLIDTNASPFFLNFAANEWLLQRLEFLAAIVLASAAFCMVSLPPGTLSAGFIGMALSYGLSLNISMVAYIQNQSTLANHIVSMERLNQYMHIPSEAPEVIEHNRPPQNWPSAGKVEIHNLQVRYRPDTPLVLRGITCIFEGGDKIGVVGRTGSGKTTLIGALFRIVEPAGGGIIVDGIDICSIGLHDLRSHFGIIPQDPTLFNGTVRFNLDPLSQYSDKEIWEVLAKCQLREVVKQKEKGLNSLVLEDGSNWSMGQRQLFCLGRALLRRSKILVLDEATASIDNATDMILQKIIRSEFAECTVITVAHRIPTVMDCTKVLAISDGKMVEYDEPMKLMQGENSLFGELVREYWCHMHSTGSNPE